MRRLVTDRLTRLTAVRSVPPWPWPRSRWRPSRRRASRHRLRRRSPRCSTPRARTPWSRRVRASSRPTRSPRRRASPPARGSTTCTGCTTTRVTPRVFAISGTGQTLGEFALSGATAVDWEDIAAGPGPSAGVSYLYVGDIGDNTSTRTSVQVYRVPEPSVDPDVAAVDTPDADRRRHARPSSTRTGRTTPRRCSLDPATGDLFVVTKDLVRRRRPGVPGAAQPGGRHDHDDQGGHRVTRRGAGRHRRRHHRRGRRDRAPHLLRRVPLSPIGRHDGRAGLRAHVVPGRRSAVRQRHGRRRSRRARRSGSRATGGATSR